MDIEFPPGLTFLRDLCPQWPEPPASETGMRQIAETLYSAAGQFHDLIPQLAGVAPQLAAVLTGRTADVFTLQFAALLDGQCSVGNDVDAIEALAGLADNLSTEIEYFKLTAISTLAIAAATITWALFNADWTMGASLSQIPIAQLLAQNTIRQLAEMVVERIGAALAATLSKTALARMLVEAGVGAVIGAGQELAVEGFQDLEGQRHGIDLGQAAKSALAMGVSGMAAAVVGHDLGELFGQDGTLPMRILKGAVTGAASGLAANAAANLIGGNDVGANTFLSAGMGFAGGFAPRHAQATPSGFDADTPDSAAPANAIDNHPTLRFDKQPDGTFAWPGEQTSNGTEPQAHTASAPGPTTEPTPAAAERVGPPSNALSAAGDSGARPVEATTTTPAAAADAGQLRATSVTAGLDAAPAAHVWVGSHPPEGTLDPSITSPATYTGPPTTTASPPVSSTPLQSNPVSAATPTVPNAGAPLPAPIPPPASPGPNAALSSPTPDPPARPADILPAGKSGSEPAAAPAAGRLDATTTTTHADPGTDDTAAEHDTSAQAAEVDRAARTGRPEASSHAVGREYSAAADRQQRPAEPVNQRQDTGTRPDATRRDSGTGPRGRPGKLPHSTVARDTGDLQPAAVRTPDPLAALEDIGGIKARHDDSGPDHRELELRNGGGDGTDGWNIPGSGTAGGDDFARALQDYRAQDPRFRTADAVSELPRIDEILGDQARPPRQRILVFCDRWARNNGMETLNIALCGGLAADHDVYLYVKRPPEVEVPDGVTVIGPRNGKPLASRYQNVNAFLADLPESVDMVIGHGHDGGMAAVHAAAHRYPDAKCVRLIHRFPMQSDPIGRTPIHARAQLAADIYLARHSDLVAGVGPMLAAEALVSSSMAGRASIHELRPSLTMAEQPPLPDAGAPKRVLLFGRTDDPSKGAAVTADIVRELRNRGHDTAKLVVLGADPRTLRQAHDTLAALVGHPDAVEVLPRTSNPEELQAIIRSATVVIMPSRVEPFGLVVTEAIEQGVPVMMPSSSGAGQFLASLPGYREAAKGFNLVKQHLYAPPSVDTWADRLDVVLGDLPAAWANARQLQARLASFSAQQSAQHLVDTALNTRRRPPLPGIPSRARVRVVGWGVVVDPYGDEAGDHDLILAVADAMETDPEVKEAIARNFPVNFGSVQAA